MIKVRQKADFTGKIINVGMDVHLDQWNIAIFVEGSFVRSFQQPPKPEVLNAHLKENYPGANFTLAYEAGFCGYWICRELRSKGLNCIVVNAADVPKGDKERLTKNDKNDAKSIGEALNNESFKREKAIYVPSPEMESDRLLVRHRLRLQRDIGRVKNRIKGMLYFLGIPIPERFQKSNWSNAFIRWLKDLSFTYSTARTTLLEMVEQLELLRQKMLVALRHIRALSKSERYLKENQLLRSLPGIGPIVAITLQTEIVDIKRFKNFYHFNSFIGFRPTEHSSGLNKKNGPLTPRHHSPLREFFIEAAWQSIRTDPALLLAYNDLKKKMNGKQAIIRIARKLANRLFTVWQKQIPYEKGIVV